MRKLLLLFLCSLFLIVGCTKEETSNYCGIECIEADMSEYPSLEGKQHVFLEVNYEEALELLNDETYTGILYYGYPSCPWCEEAVVIMDEVAKEYHLSIHYVNKKSDFNIAHKELEEKTVQHLIQYIELEKDEQGNPHLYVPEVLVIKEGKILSHHIGTIEAHDAHEREMNEDEIAQLRDIYKKMFKEIKVQ